LSGSFDHDAVIVGGGPAGLVTAIALARVAPELARRTVVVEKARYPRDKYCAGALGGRGDRILAELGAEVRVPSVDIAGMSFRARGGEHTERVGGIGRVVRRIEFDHALAERARRAGVRIEEGTRVTSVQRVDVGALVTTSRGELRARAVVGADGVGSVVRRALGLGRGLLRAQVLEIDTEPAPGDPPRDILRFDASDGALPGYTWDFPTSVGGEQLVSRGIYHLKWGEAEPDLHAAFAERCARQGLDLERYPNKRFAERGLEPSATLARGSTLLAGEAAGIDPVTGEGIAQAIEYGAMAGRFLAEALVHRRPIETWTGHVARSRLGLDLRVRARLVEEFFGPHRPEVEALILQTPSVLRSGARHFAALEHDPRDLASLAFATAKHYLRALATI
jgi:flavin-dependent dehydrogenase